VGVDDYESGEINDLRYTATDVDAMAQVLVGSAGFPAERVIRMTTGARSSADNRPTQVGVLKRLDQLARQIKPEDTFVFYFSGHGFSRGNGKHFLGTVNADPTSMETLELSTVSLARLQQKMAAIRAKRVFFIIDACRNDPEKGKGDVPNTLSQGFSRDLVRVAQASGGGLAGTAVLFACSEGERAYEWPAKKHGAFTYFLLEGLRGKAADARGELTANGLGEYVQNEVIKWGLLEGKQQTPDLKQDGAARLLLARVKGGPPVPAISAADLPPVILAKIDAVLEKDSDCRFGRIAARRQYLQASDGRLHWGVRFNLRKGQVAPRMPRRAVALATELDPASVAFGPDRRFQGLYRVSAKAVPPGLVRVISESGSSPSDTLVFYVNTQEAAEKAADLLRQYLTAVREESK